ncbi:MAG: hypothetical protein IJ122_00475 [Methanobrevibacter sp.]|nr:hypothetical protein [Methanobrevibacter sp.]
MINEYNQQSISLILSNAAQKAYDKIKALILKIFSIIKKEDNDKNLKEEFYESYVDFARKLDGEGHFDESNIYMDICSMYLNLMDRPDELLSHEGFFLDLFKAFDELLFVKINKPSEYDKKYREFMIYFGTMDDYYCSNLAIPSPYFDEDSLNKLTGYLSGLYD